MMAIQAVPKQSCQDPSRRQGFSELQGLAGDTDEQVVASKARARKRWIVRTTVVLLGAFVVFFLVVTLQRDAVHRDTVLGSSVKLCSELQASLDIWQRLPARVSALGQSYYASAIERQYAKQTLEPMIVVAFNTTQLMLRQDGRCVIVYEKGKVRPEWLALDEFRTRWAQQREKVRAFEKEWRSRPPQLP